MLDILFVGGSENDIALLNDLPINIDQVQNGMIALIINSADISNDS